MPPGHPGMRGAESMPSDRPEHFGRRGHGLESMMKKLGITDEQKKQIRSLYVGFSDRTRKARSEAMAFKDEKKTMMMSGKIDQQKLAQIDDQLVKLRSDVMREKLKLKRDRLALLTPEQLERIADFKAEKAFRHKMMKRHHGPMMQGGGGRGFEGRHSDEGRPADEGRFAEAGPQGDAGPLDDED